MQDFSEEQKKFLKNLFANLNTTINEKTSEIRKELKEQIAELKREALFTASEFERKIKELEIKNREQHQNIIFLERKVRKNNVVIYGINTDEPDLVTRVLEIIKKLDINIGASDLNDVYFVKKQKDKPNPVIVEFLSYQKKILVLKNAFKLKGKNIYISRDQCYEDREKNKILLYHQKQARAKGESAYIRGEKLFIGNEPYTIEELKKYMDFDEDIQNKEGKVESAPATPNHVTRQTNLMQEFETVISGVQNPEYLTQQVIDSKETSNPGSRVTRSNTGGKKNK